MLMCIVFKTTQPHVPDFFSSLSRQLPETNSSKKIFILAHAELGKRPAFHYDRRGGVGGTVHLTATTNKKELCLEAASIRYSHRGAPSSIQPLPAAVPSFESIQILNPAPSPNPLPLILTSTHGLCWGTKPCKNPLGGTLRRNYNKGS